MLVPTWMATLVSASYPESCDYYCYLGLQNSRLLPANRSSPSLVPPSNIRPAASASPPGLARYSPVLMNATCYCCSFPHSTFCSSLPGGQQTQQLLLSSFLRTIVTACQQHQYQLAVGSRNECSACLCASLVSYCIARNSLLISQFNPIQSQQASSQSKSTSARPFTQSANSGR
jgi:hypothetical protein